MVVAQGFPEILAKLPGLDQDPILDGGRREYGVPILPFFVSRLGRGLLVAAPRVGDPLPMRLFGGLGGRNLPASDLDLLREGGLDPRPERFVQNVLDGSSGEGAESSFAEWTAPIRQSEHLLVAGQAQVMLAGKPDRLVQEIQANGASHGITLGHGQTKS